MTQFTTNDLKLRMREFIEDSWFTLVSQPIFDFAARRICGYEMLSRLKLPEQGMASPGQFLPVINEMQLHSEFDCHIFYETCHWMRQLLDADKAPDWLSVNFNRKTLGENGIVTKLVKIADGFGIPHHRLGIELTEYENAEDEKLFCENIRGLKKEGFLILVDDMGTGVTSSRDLLNLPVDIVKLDRSLLLAASTEEGAESLRKLVRLINGLGMKSLCEGVEKYTELQIVQDAGCVYGQGFLFSPPASTNSVENMLGRNAR